MNSQWISQAMMGIIIVLFQIPADAEAQGAGDDSFARLQALKAQCAERLHADAAAALELACRVAVAEVEIAATAKQMGGAQDEMARGLAQAAHAKNEEVSAAFGRESQAVMAFADAQINRLAELLCDLSRIQLWAANQAQGWRACRENAAIQRDTANRHLAELKPAEELDPKINPDESNERQWAIRAAQRLSRGYAEVEQAAVAAEKQALALQDQALLALAAQRQVAGDLRDWRLDLQDQAASLKLAVAADVARSVNDSLAKGLDRVAGLIQQLAGKR